MAINVVVPAMGESVTEAVLVKWLKADGELVAAAEPIAELETDKANVDLPAPNPGVLHRVKDEGQTVHVGETIARIDDAASPAPPAGASAPTAAPPRSLGAESAVAVTGLPVDPRLSPAVRRMAAEHKLDVSAITGTGPGGRLTKEDLDRHLQSAPETLAATSQPQGVQPQGTEPLGAAPARLPRGTSEALPPVSVPAPTMRPTDMRYEADGTKRAPMSKMRRRIAENLVRAQQTAAILTTFNEIDLFQVMELRRRYRERFEKVHGVGLGFMSFFARAVTMALGEFPHLNAFLDGDDVLYHQDVNLGIAVSTDRGLAVPVLHRAQQMSFAQIEAEIKRLAQSVRDGKLALDELSGGTFTITNGGVFGSLLSTPILNPPQSGILGMHKIEDRPVVVAGKIEIRPMMYVALSYDHRLVDGRESVSFLVRVKELLEDPARLLLQI
jgi:2-oxoglutarate dehydrogenase E2 component (dihydrolipoamide succinyltransferase)